MTYNPELTNQMLETNLANFKAGNETTRLNIGAFREFQRLFDALTETEQMVVRLRYL